MHRMLKIWASCTYLHVVLNVIAVFIQHYIVVWSICFRHLVFVCKLQTERQVMITAAKYYDMLYKTRFMVYNCIVMILLLINNLAKQTRKAFSKIMNFEKFEFARKWHLRKSKIFPINIISKCIRTYIFGLWGWVYPLQIL